MNIWGMGDTWYKDSSRKDVKEMKEKFCKKKKAGIGYSPDDPHGKVAWKNLKSVQKGDIIYIKKWVKGKLEIINLGIVTQEIGTQLDDTLTELENGYGIDVKWIIDKPISTDVKFRRGAFYLDDREEIRKIVIEKIAE